MPQPPPIHTSAFDWTQHRQDDSTSSAPITPATLAIIHRLTIGALPGCEHRDGRSSGTGTTIDIEPAGIAIRPIKGWRTAPTARSPGSRL